MLNFAAAFPQIHQIRAGLGAELTSAPAEVQPLESSPILGGPVIICYQHGMSGWPRIVRSNILKHIPHQTIKHPWEN